MMSDAYWRKPMAWDRAAAADGVVRTVFCSSMADVFETHPVADIHAQLDRERSRLWRLVEQTPNLVWLLLTKRMDDPDVIHSMVPWDRQWPPNVWLGTSVEDTRRAAERLPVLTSIPATQRFVSCEPLLSDLDLRPWIATGGIGWIITGGESGAKARVSHPDWFRSIRDQCVDHRIPFHHKQNGMYVPDSLVYQAGETEADWDIADLDLPGKGTGCAVDPDGTISVRWTDSSVTVKAAPRVGAWWMRRVRRAADAGRDLDGRIWDETPAHQRQCSR